MYKSYLFNINNKYEFHALQNVYIWMLLLLYRKKHIILIFGNA